MEQLIATITEKAGINKDQAKSAIEAVIGFLKQKLPASLAGQLDHLVPGAGGESEGGEGASSEGGAMGAISKGLGGLFGK